MPTYTDSLYKTVLFYINSALDMCYIRYIPVKKNLFKKINI